MIFNTLEDLNNAIRMTAAQSGLNCHNINPDRILVPTNDIWADDFIGLVVNHPAIVSNKTLNKYLICQFNIRISEKKALIKDYNMKEYLEHCKKLDRFIQIFNSSYCDNEEYALVVRSLY